MEERKVYIVLTQKDGKTKYLSYHPQAIWTIEQDKRSLSMSVARRVLKDFLKEAGLQNLSTIQINFE